MPIVFDVGDEGTKSAGVEVCAESSHIARKSSAEDSGARNAYSSYQSAGIVADNLGTRGRVNRVTS